MKLLRAMYNYVLDTADAIVGIVTALITEQPRTTEQLPAPEAGEVAVTTATETIEEKIEVAPEEPTMVALSEIAEPLPDFPEPISEPAVESAETTPPPTPVKLSFYNEKTGKWKIPLFELLNSMGVDKVTALSMSEQQLCPCCGDKVPTPVGEGKVSLCDLDFAVFQSLTRFEDGRKLGAKIAAMSRRTFERVLSGAVNLLPPKEMVEALSSKTLEQAGSESLFGFCPCCEKPHRHSTRNLKAGPDGHNRKILFCDECFDLYRRRNKFAVAIAKMARKESFSGARD